MTLRFGFALLALGMVAVPALSQPPPAEPAPRVSGPATHENVSVYFVHGSSVRGPVPDTLQEALAKGTVEVQETGNVQELKIENKGQTPVFVQFGDIVKGGQQDRVLTISMVLQPGSGVVPIGAYCVEQGRWAARGTEDVKRFALSEALIPSREAKIAMANRAAPKEGDNTAQLRAGLGATPSARPVNPFALEAGNVMSPPRTAGEQAASVNRQARSQDQASGGQSEVWRSVAAVQSGLTASLDASVASEKSRTSLQLALEHEKLKAAQTAYLAALEPAGLTGDDIVGVVIAVNGRLSSADVYPSNGLFRKMWPKLARAAATEALSGRKQAEVAKSGPATPPAIEAVTAFLAEAETGKASELSLGQHTKIETRNSPKAVRMEARKADGALVHRNYVAY